MFFIIKFSPKYSFEKNYKFLFLAGQDFLKMWGEIMYAQIFIEKIFERRLLLLFLK